MQEIWLKLQHWIDQYPWLEMLNSLAILCLVAAVAYLITKKVVVVGIRKLLARVSWIKNSAGFQKHSVIRRIANIVPALVIINGIGTVPHLSEKVVQLVQMLSQAWIFVTMALAISDFLNIFNLSYQTNPKSANKPIKGYLQLIKLIVYIVCGLMIIGTFLKKDVFTLLAGFGAMAAVLMLVFQNTILSLVASVQISSYDMIRIGDWIEMPSLGADGTVIDIALHTVTVQNFDKTYTVIPTNKLVTDTFKNWRGMTDLGRRRIKRAFYVDQSSVHFLSDDDIARLKNFLLLETYIDKKSHELAEWNSSVKELFNQRRMTNLGTFRAYMLLYLQKHDGIAQDQTLLVRQLQPTAQGLPLELYCFTNTTAWVAYEDIQSDIFDHLFAIISEFGLRAYQAPSGADFQNIQLERQELHAPELAQKQAKNTENT